MKEHAHKISLGIVGLLAIALICGVVFAYTTRTKSNAQNVGSFEECVAAGYPVMESYPEKCTIPGGKSFTRDVGNEVELRNQIRVSNPRPNQKIISPLKISGEALGNWFWEATFQIDLVDANGKGLGHGYGTSKGEWMTTEFVPFTAEVVFEQPKTKTGRLILEKANPSALPENGATLVIPVSFN